MVKGGSVGLGGVSMLRDMNMSMTRELQMDSIATQGISNRRGIGKIRHLHIPLLWIQEKVSPKGITTKEIDGTTNTADIGTKVLSEMEYDKFLEELVFEC